MGYFRKSCLTEYDKFCDKILNFVTEMGVQIYNVAPYSFMLKHFDNFLVAVVNGIIYLFREVNSIFRLF